MSTASPSARDRILSRLKSAPKRTVPDRPDWAPPGYGEQRFERFKTMLEASHAEVHAVTRADWPQRLATILANKGLTSLLYSPTSEAGRQFTQGWGGRAIAYDRTIEDMKPVLVHEAQAALTTARAGIAQTGSLVLWPTPDEPRLMSLLPPVHIALLERSSIADSLFQLMTTENWASGLPTNALLISGPSKTADIEQTLAYGVHGPKELIVLVVGDA